MDLHENLKGKTVVITGGSGILCREFAYAYAKQGMNVAVLGRTLSKLEEVRDKINELGGNGLAVVCDVVDKDSVINAKKVVNDTFGKVDILVNGAGGNHPKGTTTKEYFEKGTPFSMAEGVKIDIPDVSVYRLEADTCMYTFNVRRWFENMPYLYLQDTDIANSYEGYAIEESMKYVNVVDDTGVSTFKGPSESDVVHSLYQDTQMVGVEQALDIASKKLASFLKLEVQEVKIGYASYMTDTGQGFNEDTAVYYPFWKFSGVNTVKNQMLNVYVDMISGAVYYTFGNA